MIKKDDFGTLVTHYLNYIDVKPQTKRNYREILDEFTTYVMTLSDLPTRSDLMTYRESLKAREFKASTIQLHVVVIRNFYRWFHIEGYGPNAAEEVKGMKMESSFKRESLSVEDSKRLLKRAKHLASKSLSGKRNYAMVALLLTTGLRTIEVERTNVEDIDQIDNGYVLYIMGKGRDDKDTSVKLSPQVYKIIEDYLIARQDDYKPLFISHRGVSKGKGILTRCVRDVVKNLLRDIGIDSTKYSAHSLRHTTATLSLLEGANIEDTQQLLRHKDPGTTQIYIHRIRKMKDFLEYKISDTLLGPPKSKR
jgi:site-specific recombinase XerD